MDAALAWRTKAFFFVGLPGAFLVALGEPLSGLFESRSEPDALTAILWGLAAVDSIVVARFLFGYVLKAPNRSLEDAAKSLSFLGAALATLPLTFGFVLLVVSGDAWRLYAFVPISAVSAIYLWRRIESMLREAERAQATAPAP